MEPTNKPNQKKRLFKALEKEIAKVNGYTLTFVEYQFPNNKTEHCIKAEDPKGNVKKLFL